METLVPPKFTADTGVEQNDVEQALLSPSCPAAACPQHLTEPPVRMAQVCEFPADMYVAAVPSKFTAVAGFAQELSSQTFPSPS